MGGECSKLRQPMRAILALSRAQLLLIVVTRSRDLSRDCHVTKHKMPAKSNFPMSNFENSGTIQFSSSRSTSRGLCPKNFEKGRTLIITALILISLWMLSIFLNQNQENVVERLSRIVLRRIDVLVNFLTLLPGNHIAVSPIKLGTYRAVILSAYLFLNSKIGNVNGIVLYCKIPSPLAARVRWGQQFS